MSIESTPIFKRYLPSIQLLESNENSIVTIWDIPNTIKELSYLTHSHYRYYGKFPSTVAGQIIEQLPPPSENSYILDNFSGSGTTLVEAKLRGIDSYAIDISWLSVLASNVKSSHLDIHLVNKKLADLIAWFESNKDSFIAPDDTMSNKWFTNEAARDLSVIQKYLLNLPKSLSRSFLILAFVGIVRRVSKAHDGEVRPHINKEKKQRDVITAFTKKVKDMCQDHVAFMDITDENTIAECFLSSNLELPKKFDDKNCYLVISHPPYLNSFNYSPVFNLEFYWGSPFESEYTSGNVKLHKKEMKAHPANESITSNYFDHLLKCYSETYRIQDKGSYLAVVIGDCTRFKKLVPVIKETIKIIESIGYKIKETNYRTTHYGLGKYAYSHRADYHGDEEEKKDAVLIFKK